MALDEKRALADAVIVNDGSIDTLDYRLGEISSKWHLHGRTLPLE
jgi:hypothetical protein